MSEVHVFNAGPAFFRSRLLTPPLRHSGISRALESQFCLFHTALRSGAK